MESKRTDRKLNSWFWHILYTLPLLTLAVLFIGYLGFYKTTGSELISQEEFVTIEYKGTDYITSDFVENLYFNINLSIEEVDYYLSTLSYVDTSYFIFYNESYSVAIMDVTSIDSGYVIVFVDLVNNSQEFIYSSSSLFSSQYGADLGWNIDFNGILELNSTSNVVGSDEATTVNPSNISSYFVSTTPIEVTEIIKTKESYFTIPYEEIIYHDEVPAVLLSSSSKKFYFNTNFTGMEFQSLCSSIVGDLDNYYFTTDNSNSLRIIRASDGSDSFYYLMYYDLVAYSSASVSGSGIDFVGWNPILENPIAFDVPANLDFAKIALFGDLFVEEFSIPAYDEKITYQLSLFDYSLTQSVITFDSFVLPVLSNGFNDIFEIVGFDCTSFLARFIIILFTWMVQVKFIHIIVDVLSFVPDMYHDFTNGKRC